jgi:hypothetical protein
VSRTDLLAHGRQRESAVHVPVTLSAWQYEPARFVEYNEQMVLLGGALLMACTAVLSVLGNLRGRRAAEREAHRWRSLGSVRVVVAGPRMRVCGANGSSRVWEGTVARFHAYDGCSSMDVLFVDGPPLRLAGRGLDVIVKALSGRITR